ncbi:S-adenosyl-L-methionine-dependent methyltransferase [Xylaria sp. FL0933]|nr:S-adenosyl-L-methionine-dependent methyltransferase [Xylaria sp. FL0933]
MDAFSAIYPTLKLESSVDHSLCNHTVVAEALPEVSLSPQDQEEGTPTTDAADEADQQSQYTSAEESDLLRRSNVVVALPSSTLTHPASHFEGFVAPAPEASESHAVTTLLGSRGPRGGDDDHIEFDLNYFSIYIDTSHYRDELRPLQHLFSKTVKYMYFDGIIQHGDRKFYLRKIRFCKLSVGNLGKSNHTVGDQIWILSQAKKRLGKEIYYRLGSPAPEYRRFYLPFLWIADLAKHVIDYCEHRDSQRRHVVLDNFKSRFSTWMKRTHTSSAAFAKWHAANRTIDFRGAVVANIDYIHNQAYNLDHEIISQHHLWREVKTLDHYQPSLGFKILSPPGKRKGTPEPREQDLPSKTIVTPYVYKLFSHMVFGELLESKEASMSVKAKKTEHLRQTKSMFSWPSSSRSMSRTPGLIESIEPGDVISTPPDNNATTDTGWERGSSMHCEGDYPWFALVQEVHISRHGKRSFDVLWLYQPIDTPCSVMKYPWRNELFLSNNCTCHSRMAKVQGHEVLSTHEVEWFGGPGTSAEFFVRQTYIASECRWASLRKEHFNCGDEDAFSPEPSRLNQYRVGDTILAETKTLHLEPFLIEAFVNDTDSPYLRMRQLLRRREVDKTARSAPPNELVYSQRFLEMTDENIERRCIVRVFRIDEEVPPPYNRDGTGDVFFITHEEIELEGILMYCPLQTTHLGSFRQGFNPVNTTTPKLRGLDLFCGGGNFGRGLEEGDGVEMLWSNDLWEGAIHTYMANADSNRCTPFLCSIDDLLIHALKDDKSVPAPGDVQFISAGSPCPGFSRLTIDKTTSDQRKNQSLVASFASFVELYRPLYGVLENVPSMVNSKFQHSCVFSQLVCALVGLGYQTQVLFLDAWSFGSSQGRSRVFLAFTAPGLRVLKAPRASHSHPENTPLTKLGKMSCGRPFDSRKIVPTPFKFVSIKEATGDLPDIQDGKADYCVGYPDHRLSIGYTHVLQKQIQTIPAHPYGMNFIKSWRGTPGVPGVITASERLLFPDGQERVKRNSKGWGRVNPNRLIGTIPTKCQPTDARVGQTNHWDQDRPITIMEARRAQGFLDHEVIVGTPEDQYKVIGNSVSRHVALVLGLAIREAWQGTLLDEDLVANIHPETTSNGASTDRSGKASTIRTPCSLDAFTGEANRKRSRSVYADLVVNKRQRNLEPDDSLQVE